MCVDGWIARVELSGLLEMFDGQLRLIVHQQEGAERDLRRSVVGAQLNGLREGGSSFSEFREARIGASADEGVAENGQKQIVFVAGLDARASHADGRRH